MTEEKQRRKPGPKGSRAKMAAYYKLVVKLHGAPDDPNGLSLNMIALQYNVERSTVCKWLHRGRKLLAQEEVARKKRAATIAKKKAEKETAVAEMVVVSDG